VRAVSGTHRPVGYYSFARRARRVKTMTTSEGSQSLGRDTIDGPQGAGQASRHGDHKTGEFDAGDFIVDHDVDPPEEIEPTTTA
jgi:hypothetical protein